MRERKALYAAVWRWHFYAGLYVAPFLVILALTGLAMLAHTPIERWQFGPLLTNADGDETASHQARLDAVRGELPAATIVRYQPGRTATDTTRVSLTLEGRPHTAFVDARTARVRGVVDDGHRVRVVAERLHGTLLVGTWGDRLIEIAASLGILLIASGVYLWWPRGSSLRQALTVSRGGRRLMWRDLHRVTGAVLAPVLALYLVSGLAWTGIWGERYVQTWSALGAATAVPDDEAVHAHETLNADSTKVVPWNLEQLPVPSVAPGEGRITLDAAIEAAQAVGIGERFWVGVPADDNGVWTVAQTAMNGDVTDPRQELTVHVNPHTGGIVGRAGWREYGPMARAMAAGIPLHEGQIGWWNLAAAALVCLLVIALSASGLVTWWLRRPARGWRLAAPPRPERAHVPAATWAIALGLAMAFPLAGATIVTIAALDWVIVRRLPALRQLLN
ncbi:MAG: PepSY-associated TM helix domain-containing protein [Vicinamibacterales bacterium]